MSKIIDDLGYRIKVPTDEFLAITLLDNGANPRMKFSNKSLQRNITEEYKRRLVINISAFVTKSSKNKRTVFKILKIRDKTHKKKSKKYSVRDKLEKFHWKKLDKLFKQILQYGVTKKRLFPKSRRTRKTNSK